MPPPKSEPCPASWSLLPVQNTHKTLVVLGACKQRGQATGGKKQDSTGGLHNTIIEIRCPNVQRCHCYYVPTKTTEDRRVKVWRDLSAVCPSQGRSLQIPEQGLIPPLQWRVVSGRNTAHFRLGTMLVYKSQASHVFLWIPTSQRQTRFWLLRPWMWCIHNTKNVKHFDG